jgi:signal transduction histidine kinase
MKPSEFGQLFCECINSHLREKGVLFAPEDLEALFNRVEKELIYDCVHEVVRLAEGILEIDPSCSEKEILRSVARNIVLSLDGEFASIWIYDSEWKETVVFGSYPLLLEDHALASLGQEVSMEVIATGQNFLVPDLSQERKFTHADRIGKLGIHSMMAIPFSLPRFSIKEIDIQGVLQIYFREKDRNFTPLETEIAEVLSRRVSHVIARKRIKDLQKSHLIKDRIAEHLFLKLARQERIKFKDVFNAVIPELAEIMKIQRCALFSVSEDRESVTLEAGFPESGHGIGKVFSAGAPYIDAVINNKGPFGEFENEIIYPSHLLIRNPGESQLLPPEVKQFLGTQEIHSVLYIPLRVDEATKYFLAFDAQAYHKQFTEEEIEIFDLFGKELMKALKMERMGDTLHDFKNPAIAAAGFARRVQKILEGKDFPEKEAADRSLEIIMNECSRLQELALALHGEGRECVVDMTEILRKRFLINEEALKESGKRNVHLVQKELASALWVRCYPLHMERVFDNLLNNASNAIPDEGGELSVRAFQREMWAVAEIVNTGEIPAEERDRCLRGESRGRGMNITNRLVKQMGGIIWVECQEGRTKFGVMLPMARP